MKYIVYDTIESLNLPKFVEKSLRNQDALANIRELHSSTYIVLNFPDKSGILQPICARSNENELTLFMPRALENTLEKPSSITDLVFLILHDFEMNIRDVSKTLDVYEEHMERGITKDDIKKLFNLNQRLLSYQSSINAIGKVMDYIVDHKPRKLWSSDTDYELTNIRIEIDQMDRSISMNRETIDAIVNVSDVLFTSRLNITMKRLASITLVLSIPTLITSFYGMNILLPYQDHPHALAIVVGLSSLLTVGTLVFLYRKDLL